MAATVKETAQSFFETNSQPHSLAGSAMTAKRAGPGVNVTFLEISRKKFTRFCRNFKNVAERAEAFGGLDFFGSFCGNDKCAAFMSTFEKNKFANKKNIKYWLPPASVPF